MSLLSLSPKKYSIADNHGVAQRWLVVTPFGVTDPMVGWKWALPSVVASRYLVLISIFPVLCVELE